MAGPEAEASAGAEEQPTSSTPTPPTSDPVTTDGASSSAPSTTSPAKPVDNKNLGINFLLQGKRHLVTKDFAGAIESLGEACRLLTETQADETAVFFENAEAHFFYGKALLEQSRLELGVLEGVPEQPGKGDDTEEDSEEEEEEEDDEEDSDQPASSEPREAECTTNGSSEASKAKAASSADEPCVSSSNDPAEEDLAVPSPKDPAPSASSSVSASAASTSTGGVVVDNEQPSTSSGEGAAPAEEELTNLELAWEVLELAKLGYTKLLLEDPEHPQGKALLQKRLADTHCSLGEVATESEMYSQAIDEFQTGLNILLQIENDSREIAQYYFQMGLAYSFDKKFPDAVSSFRKSVEIIENRIAQLKQKLSEEVKDVEERKSNEEEVQELTALLPELQEKIQDTIDAEKESHQMEQEEQQEKEIIARNSPVKNPNPANNINHLVKKKKKADEAPNNERPVKKLCTDVPAASTTTDGEKSNGNGEVVPPAETKNGHAPAVEA